MTALSALLSAEKWAHVDLGHQGIDLSTSRTFWDAIQAIISHADAHPGDPLWEKPADRLWASIVIPLRNIVAQQFSPTKRELSIKRYAEEAAYFKASCAARKARALMLLLGEGQSMTGFGQDEATIRTKLQAHFVAVEQDVLAPVPEMA